MVWLAVSGAAWASATAVPWACRPVAGGRDEVADLLVAVCAIGLALALAWLWLVTTVTVAGLVGDHDRAARAVRTVLTGRTGHVGATRRLVLAACGCVAAAGVSAPAAGAAGDGHHLVAGLGLPDRAVAPARHRPHRSPAPTAHPTAHPAASAAASPSGERYVVRAGDSLWSIARAHPDGSGSVDERWRAIWRANRDVVGEDPDLILPGQALRLPDHSDADRYTDGER